MNPTPAPDDDERPPSVAAYKAAFLSCREVWSELDLPMLEAHHRAPDHTVTAGELAAAVGLPNYSAANLRYGLYAGHLCEALGRRPEFNIGILCSFSGGVPGSEFIRWTMHPEAVAALEELRWVRKRAS